MSITGWTSVARRWTMAIISLAALSATALATAQDAAFDGGADEDPSARVGRVSALIGAVDISPQAGAAWELATLNQPVTTQTALWSPPGSRAEIRIGSASVRLADETQAVFSQLDDQGIAIDVAQGTVRARVRYLPAGDAFSLSADGVRAQALTPGDYRVSYDADRRAYTVRVLAGRLRVVTATNAFDLEAGQESLIEQGGAALQLRPLGELDGFDSWAQARDQQQDTLASARYVSPETTGIEALDDNGRWETTQEYGPVWYPRAVRSDWAPYRYGHWEYLRPWGWSWVDDAPWGFAPFHYGRWALVGNRWGWVPGPVVARPVWAPALVGYVGGSASGSVSVSVNIGGGAPVGWFPLGPAERYRPPYRYSRAYQPCLDVINIDHRRRDRWGRDDGDDDDHRHRGGDAHDRAHDHDRRMTRQPIPGTPAYRYARDQGALTLVSADVFRTSRPVARERLRPDAAQIALLTPLSPGVRWPSTGQALPPNAGAPSPGAVLRLPAPARHARDHDRDDRDSRHTARATPSPQVPHSAATLPFAVANRPPPAVGIVNRPVPVVIGARPAPATRSPQDIVIDRRPVNVAPRKAQERSEERRAQTRPPVTDPASVAHRSVNPVQRRAATPNSALAILQSSAHPNAGVGARAPSLLARPAAPAAHEAHRTPSPKPRLPGGEARGQRGTAAADR